MGVIGMETIFYIALGLQFKFSFAENTFYFMCYHNSIQSRNTLNYNDNQLLSKAPLSSTDVQISFKTTKEKIKIRYLLIGTARCVECC